MLVYLARGKCAHFYLYVNPLSANPTKWSNTLKQFVGNLLTNYLSVFDHFMNLALKGLSGPPYFSRNLAFPKFLKNH